MRKDKSAGMPSFGGSSLMIIFAVLCLVAFSILTVSTVTADRRLSEASARTVSDYYSADAAAEQTLAALRVGEEAEGVERDGNIYSFTYPVSENKILSVRVEISGDEYTILQWQEIYSGEWSGDDTLDLWNMESFING